MQNPHNMLCKCEPYYHILSINFFIPISRDRMKETQDFPSYPIPETQPFTPLKRLWIPQTPMKYVENLVGFSTAFMVVFWSSNLHMLYYIHVYFWLREILRLQFLLRKNFRSEWHSEGIISILQWVHVVTVMFRERSKIDIWLKRDERLEVGKDVAKSCRFLRFFDFNFLFQKIFAQNDRTKEKGILRLQNFFGIFPLKMTVERLIFLEKTKDCMSWELSPSVTLSLRKVRYFDSLRSLSMTVRVVTFLGKEVRDA